jgi:very-short-patch-repair endonuclease
MNTDAIEAARARGGVVLAEELGRRPRVTARAAGLREVHPGIYLAQTQPESVAVHLAALEAAWTHRQVVVLGLGAIWLHGYGEMPDSLVLGIPQTHELVTSPDLPVRRLSPAVLEGWRWRHGCRVVSLEIAVIQAAASQTHDETLRLCEELVRSRRTTLVRLRARCRRGLKGSGRVRAICDELAGGSMDRDVRALQRALAKRGVVLEVEVRFTNDEGGTAYADLLHRPTMTVIEVDGLQSHTSREHFRRDRRRDRWMRRRHGITTLRVDVTEIRDDVEAVADELVELLLMAAQPAA